ncbi:fumarylacetoacetate hydrolase family protein [Streptomyces natalensis]|uniref:fumarylacetoacetate hydrolase family protein n=1 Tax=Streptomyces natalensis TaxID=68242 RepID=UPI0005C8B9F5|nr:fumarylacetoacetate hydrolase family protein [Streptomyces natalensis]
MDLARLMTAQGPRYGVVDTDRRTIRLLKGPADPESLADLARPTGSRSGALTSGPSLAPGNESVPLEEARLLAPVVPGKVVVIGRNYGGRPDAAGNLIIHLKPTTSVVGPDDPIVLPESSHDVRYEGELAVVIGRTCRSVAPEDAAQHVLGYTCANDVTAWDIGTDGGQWTKAKGMDTFCPLGPWISTDLDPAAAHITTRVNGEVRQKGSTAQLTRSALALVSEVSHFMTLLPGDVLLTGTPEGSDALTPDDTVSVDIEGIGTLHSPVAAGPDSRTARQG